jgi:CDP-paratose 2-epimerase
LLFTSTNKVYGEMDNVKLRMRRGRYEPVDSVARETGFSESSALNFHSPYGCSKGCAGQYVMDYARTFRVPAVVFHMSCIYGPHQFGSEDQGWIAHFLLQALEGKALTIYGDGRQVRDVLFVEDLVNAFLLAHQKIDTLSGQSFNIGGGPENTLSLRELLQLIGELNGKTPEVHFDTWRSADQRYYVSDIRRFSGPTGWQPSVGVREGVSRLYEWLRSRQLESQNHSNRENVLSVALEKNRNGRSNGINGTFASRPRMIPIRRSSVTDSHSGAALNGGKLAKNY